MPTASLLSAWDTTAPSVSASVATGARSATVTLTGTDAASGIDRVEYQLPGSAAWATYTLPVDVALTAANQVVAYRAVDIAGNVSAAETANTGTLPNPADKDQPAGSVKVSGKVKVGKKLTAKASGWLPGATFTYQWRAGGKNIAGATKATYKPTKANLGKKITVVVTSSAAGYKKVTKTASAGKWKITAGKVAIAGKVKVGKTLKAKTSKWRPKGVKLTYQWYAKGKAIKGATKKKLKVTSAQRDKRITVKVKASKKGFAPATRTSKAVSAS